MAEKTETKTNEAEREYIIPLRREWDKVPRYKRANKAIKAIKEFLVRHMKIRDRDLRKIKIDGYLNEEIWFRGIRKPPARIKVKVTRDGENIRVELSEFKDKLKFKKAREEKIEQKVDEVATKKKEEHKHEHPEEKTEEEKKEETEKKEEEKEKKAAVVESGQQIEKQIAKTTKHEVKQDKMPKRQIRKTLAK